MKVSGKHPNESSKPPFYKKISTLEGLISMVKDTSDPKTKKHSKSIDSFWGLIPRGKPLVGMSELWVNFIECLLCDRHPAKHFIYKEEQGKLKK